MEGIMTLVLIVSGVCFLFFFILAIIVLFLGDARDWLATHKKKGLMVFGLILSMCSIGSMTFMGGSIVGYNVRLVEKPGTDPIPISPIDPPDMDNPESEVNNKPWLNITSEPPKNSSDQEILSEEEIAGAKKLRTWLQKNGYSIAKEGNSYILSGPNGQDVTINGAYAKSASGNIELAGMGNGRIRISIKGVGTGIFTVDASDNLQIPGNEVDNGIQLNVKPSEIDNEFQLDVTPREVDNQ